MLNVASYLARIGYTGPTAPTAVTLRAIHRAHLLTVPFENLDIARATKIVCEEDAFLRKIVNRSLPVSAHAYDMTARLLKLDAPVNGWEVYGKTGTSPALLADGRGDDTQDIGWFVGWASKGGRTLAHLRAGRLHGSGEGFGAGVTDVFDLHPVLGNLRQHPL